MAKYNLKNTKTTKTFDPLPEDRYNVTVTNAEVKVTANGNEMVTAELTISDGKFANRKVWNNFVFTDKTLDMISGFLGIAGCDDLAKKEDLDPQEMAMSIINKKVSVYAKPDVTNQGKPTTRLSMYRSIDSDGGSAEPAKKSNLYS